MTTTTPRILIAGAMGVLGREVQSVLAARATAPVRVLSRRAPAAAEQVMADADVCTADLREPDSLRGICRGIETVFSCAGASMKLGNFGDRRSFYAIDWQGNRNLLNEARRAGVRRFVYVSLFGGEQLRQTEYADAHERFADELRSSGLEYVIVRPTGFFSFFAEALAMARRGSGVVIGSGTPRTNPVHERDVAEVCVAALEGPADDVAVGGPDVFTRREVIELAFDVLGRSPRVRSISPALMRAAAFPLRLANRRLHALMHFGIEVSQVDVVAPSRGTRHLRSYFEMLAPVPAAAPSATHA